MFPTNRLRLTIVSISALVASLQSAASGAGIFADGQTARSMALGGAATANANGPLDALASNPAALSVLHAPALELGLQAAWAHGEFNRSGGLDTEMNNSGVIGNGAFAYPIGPVTLGFGFIPDSATRTTWRYRDPLGGADGLTSYGVRAQESEIELLRFGFGASWQITKTFSLGASAGLLYNHNRLNAPYIIQTDPALASVKVLLDMETEGWGWNGQFGALWKPLDNLQIGVSYTLETRLQTDGRAKVNASTQLDRLGLGAADPDANMDAAVTNTFPQILTGGISWHPIPKLNLIGQVDWVNWADSFDTLEVRLTKPDNADLRGLLFRKAVHDDIPLNWKDQFVFRFGAEYEIDDHWTIRAGYRYGRDPVPSETLTTLTAAIPEHVVGLGAGYRTGRYHADIAWQWHIPNSDHIGTSKLLAGEYSHSDTEISVHWLAVTVGIEF